MAVVLALCLAHRISGAPPARGLVTVDTRRAALEIDVDATWVDERWAEQLAATFAMLPPFPVDDREGVLAVAAAARELPFVAEVGTPRVLWPDGVELDVRLRRPAACALVGESFLAVAEDGVLLPGGYPAPPWIGHGFLPVIGPNDRAFDELRPGDALWEERHLAALSVAKSMRAELDWQIFETMGPPLIDASRSRFTSVDEAGVLIDLEGARRVWFGRAPWTDEPGELPAELKWESLKRAVLQLRNGEQDWDLLDVRWDQPEIRWRDETPDEAGAPVAEPRDG
jgi:hypothetical protein